MSLCGNDIIILSRWPAVYNKNCIQHCGIYTLKEIVESTFCEQRLKPTFTYCQFQRTSAKVTSGGLIIDPSLKWYLDTNTDLVLWNVF